MCKRRKEKARKFNVNAVWKYALIVVPNGTVKLNAKMQWIKSFLDGLLIMEISVIVLNAKLGLKRYLVAII